MQPASVTAVGAWPGTSALEAAKIVGELCSEFAHLPELPDRGPGGDMIGRTMTLVSRTASDFSVQTVPSGWQLTSGRVADLRRADGYWSEDLDSCEEVFADYNGDFKVQLVGPWTLAASVENRNGEKLLRDLGAVAELSQALTLTWAALLDDMRKRLPQARLVIQIDEPLIRDVLRGSIETQSKWSAYPAVDHVLVENTLREVREVYDGSSVLHCCTDEVPFDVIRNAGFSAPSFDVVLVGNSCTEALGQHIDAGGSIFLGIDPENVGAGVDLVTRIGHRVGYGVHEWNSHIVLTPPCDLIDMSMSQARAKIEILNLVSKALREVSE